MRPVRPAPPPADFDSLVRSKGFRAFREMISDETDRLAICEMLGEEPKKRRGRPRKEPGKYLRCADIPTDKHPHFWTDTLEQLWKAYGGVCSFCCLYIEEGTGDRTVDHMISRKRDWRQAYEWRNFRLACRQMNSNKGDSADVLDPFLVEDGWFALELVGFQVVPGPRAVGETLEQVRRTIEVLKLNRESRLSRQMAGHWDNYWSEDPNPFSDLKRRAPFLAAEMLRQGKVRPGDAGG